MFAGRDEQVDDEETVSAALHFIPARERPEGTVRRATGNLCAIGGPWPATAHSVHL